VPACWRWTSAVGLGRLGARPLCLSGPTIPGHGVRRGGAYAKGGGNLVWGARVQRLSGIGLEKTCQRAEDCCCGIRAGDAAVTLTLLGFPSSPHGRRSPTTFGR
jgi:hypothetical protein